MDLRNLSDINMRDLPRAGSLDVSLHRRNARRKQLDLGVCA